MQYHSLQIKCAIYAYKAMVKNTRTLASTVTWGWYSHNSKQGAFQGESPQPDLLASLLE